MAPKPQNLEALTPLKFLTPAVYARALTEGCREGLERFRVSNIGG